jgi:prophage regulatory protein
MDTETAPAANHVTLTRILRLRDVCRATGLGRSMVYRLQQEKRFPQSVKITDYAVGWVDAEIQAWIAQRAAVRNCSRESDRPARMPARG